MSKKNIATSQKNLPTQTAVSKVPKVWRAQDYVTPNITLQQIISVKEAFDIFDTDKSGVIDPIQVKNAFISLGFANHNKFVLRILQDYEAEGIQGLDFGEFLKLSTAKLGQAGTRTQVERVFKHFDISKTGKISHADMKKVAEQLSESLTEEEIEKMIIKADSDSDGFLTVDDFYNIMTNVSEQYQ